jgi:hypothetical protein
MESTQSSGKIMKSMLTNKILNRHYHCTLFAAVCIVSRFLFAVAFTSKHLLMFLSQPLNECGRYNIDVASTIIRRPESLLLKH